MRVESSHGLGKFIGSTLDLIGGDGGTLGLGATLTRVGAPLGDFGREVLGHSLGKGLGGALDLPGGIGRALHHVAALTGVGAPLGDGGVGPGSDLLGLDGGGSESSDDDGGCLLYTSDAADEMD